MTIWEFLFGPTPDLQHGSRGWDVKGMQDKINRKGGADLAVDGIFGPKTDAAVRKYQSENGLKVDGIVGPKTRAALRRFW